MSVICKKIRYFSWYERFYNSPEPLSDEIIDTNDQMVNANSSRTSNLDNMTNEVPAQDSNDKNRKIIIQKCLSSIIQIDGKYVSMATIYNEWFGLVTYARIITGGINSL